MKTSLAFLSVLSLALAGAPMQGAAQVRANETIDPVGTYDIDFELHGQLTSSVLAVTKQKDGRLLGSMEIHGQTIEFDDVSVQGQVLTLSSGGGALSLTFTFSTKDQFSGTFTSQNGDGKASGVRRKS